MDKPYLSLQSSEIALLHAAAHIFAGYIVAGQVSDDHRSKMLRRSFDEALALARHIEESVQSDRELG